MKTKLLYCLGFFIVVLSGCHTKTDDFISKYCPGSCTVIKGRLTTDDRTKPLTGVMLEVKWRAGNLFSSTTRRKTVTRTDANGNYELRFLLRDDELEQEYGAGGRFTVLAHLDPNNYLSCSGTNALLEYYDLGRDTTLEANYNLPEKAFVQVQLTNTQAMQQGDQLYTYFVYDAGEATTDSCAPSIIWNSTSGQRQVPVAANQQVIIRTTKQKAGTTSVTEETVRLEPGQTITYQVAF